MYNTTLALGFLFYRDVLHLQDVAGGLHRPPLDVEGALGGRLDLRVVLRGAIDAIGGRRGVVLRRRLLGGLRDGHGFLDVVGDVVVVVLVQRGQGGRLARGGGDWLAPFYQFHDLVRFPTQVSSRSEGIIPATFDAVTEIQESA